MDTKVVVIGFLVIVFCESDAMIPNVVITDKISCKLPHCGNLGRDGCRTEAEIEKFNRAAEEYVNGMDVILEEKKAQKDRALAIEYEKQYDEFNAKMKQQNGKFSSYDEVEACKKVEAIKCQYEQRRIARKMDVEKK